MKRLGRLCIGGWIATRLAHAQEPPPNAVEPEAVDKSVPSEDAAGANETAPEPASSDRSDEDAASDDADETTGDTDSTDDDEEPVRRPRPSHLFDPERLPPNPALESPPVSHPDRGPLNTTLAPELDPRLELGPQLGTFSRPSQGKSVEYDAGMSWGGYARVNLNQWLGFVVSAGAERHAVRAARTALGFDDLEVEGSDLSGLRLGGQLEARLAITERLWVGVGVGAGWARFVADSLVATSPVPFELPERSGVLVEALFSPRLTWHLLPNQLGISLWTNLGVPMTQSGDLFSSASNPRQTVRRDTGELLEVKGFPEFSHSLSSHLSVDLFL